MATALHRPLRTSKTHIATSYKPKNVTSKTKTTTTTHENLIDPIEERINHIRTHLLSSRFPRHIIPPEPTLVFRKFLYLGGLKSLNDKDYLTRLNITHILSVVWIQPRSAYISSNIRHLFIKADDCTTFDMSLYFEQACQFIEDARQCDGRVLVHCACGVSRSSTLCCAYLIKYHSMSIEQALTHLRSRRHIIQPNAAFLRQLIHYNEKIDADKSTVNTIHA
ncbi:hypothetical protein I4U23_013941 [Adineta vaga]|nr:hypothetical protein I4U23_013941 [Adineta vaga]